MLHYLAICVMGNVEHRRNLLCEFFSVTATVYSIDIQYSSHTNLFIIFQKLTHHPTSNNLSF